MSDARSMVGRAAAASKWFIVALACASGAARAESVFSTLSGTTISAAQLSGNAVGTWNYGAQQFNTGFNNQITSVTLALQRIGTGGTFAIELWTNSLVSGTAMPGSLVSTLASDSTSILNTGEVQATFTVNATGLSKFTDYWIVFNALNVGPGTAYWSYTDDASGPGVAGTAYMAVNDGPGWTPAYGSYRAVMEVEAVPEPGTLPLAGAGVAILAWAAGRRRRRPDSASPAAN